MATRRKDSAATENGALLPTGQIVTMVIGYPDGGSETIERGTITGASGPLVKIKKDDIETLVNTSGFYFIKAVLAER